MVAQVASATSAFPVGDGLSRVRGAQLGALAITADERYVQVVGDFVSPLPNGEISRALARARKLQPYEPYVRPRPAAGTAPAPVVTVKRRRVFVAV